MTPNDWARWDRWARWSIGISFVAWFSAATFVFVGMMAGW